MEDFKVIDVGTDDRIKLNPVSSIWFSPHKTMKYVVLFPRTMEHLVLFALLGIVLTFLLAEDFNYGYKYSLAELLAGCLLTGPLMGLLFGVVCSAILGWSGKVFGGDSDYSQVRSVFAWAMVPAVAALIIWMVESLLIGEELFRYKMIMTKTDDFLFSFYKVAEVLKIILYGWTLLLIIIGLMEAQGFSPALAVFNLLAVGLLLSLPYKLLGLYFMIVGEY